MNASGKFSICIYSDANFLAVNILENLLSKNCIVNVVTKDQKGWATRTKNISSNGNFSIVSDKPNLSEYKFDYVIFCGGFIDKNNAFKEYKDFKLSSNISASKTLIIFPSEIFYDDHINRIEPTDSTAIIFLGDLIGPRIDLASDLFIAQCLNNIVGERKLTLPIGESFHPIFVADTVKIIVRWLFSFGPYGKKILITGSQVSGDAFYGTNVKIVPDLDLAYEIDSKPRILPNLANREVVAGNLTYMLSETYLWFTKNQSELRAVKKKSPKLNLNFSKKIKLSRQSKIAIWLVSIIFLSPFLFIFTSLALSLAGYGYLIKTGKGAENTILISRAVASVSQKESSVLRYVPILGLVYKETEYASFLITKTNDAGIHLIPVIKTSAKLLDNILGTEVYDLPKFSSDLESNIAKIYPDIESVANITKSNAAGGTVLAKKVLRKIDFAKYLNLAYQARQISLELPEILGKDKAKTYFLLFQNNMELRPTGGFIGSFGLLTFDSGRISELTVNDVYTADGQLNGHVEPPAPIKKYLNEANWWLRDSNWDPDFPTSAKRAEWFLDKELGKKVDGVIAIDLAPIRGILDSTGPVFLADYGMDITSENLYEKTQGEVQNDSFPGTHQKASFLTALSRNLISKMGDLPARQKLPVLKTFYENLNSRSIQVFFHNDSIQKTFESLRWDGAVFVPSCGANCYPDFVGLAEANVGVNKANYFIKRDMKMNVNISAYKIDHELAVTYKDAANPALGYSGKYKNYVRAIVPLGAYNIGVSITSGGTTTTLVPEITEVKGRKEAGILVELLAGETKDVRFSWTLAMPDTPHTESYGLYIRKQGGTGDDPIAVRIFGTGLNLTADPRFALTKDGSYGYNTVLTQDLFSRFTW